MTKSKILVLGSNATRIEVQGGTGPTGNYLNETVVPVMALIEAGYNVVLATPNGTKPHMDEASDSPVHFGGDQAAYSRAKAFWANDPIMNHVRTLRFARKTRKRHSGARNVAFRVCEEVVQFIEGPVPALRL